MHLLFINHNGKADMNRPNTLKLLNLINKNISALKQLDVKMQIFSMTDMQIKDNYNEIKRYKIKSFPTLIISSNTKNNVVEGYNDIYNVYNNEITRIRKNNNTSSTYKNDTILDIEDDSNIDEMDSMDYIMSQMGDPSDDDNKDNTSEAMSQDDIKKGMSKFESKSKLVTTKYDTVTNKITKNEDKIEPSPGNDKMEDIMMERMMENL